MYKLLSFVVISTKMRDPNIISSFSSIYNGDMGKTTEPMQIKITIFLIFLSLGL